jgi:hypothetical protein
MNTVTFSVLAALLALLTLALSAGADCAWVLWASVTSGYPGVSGSTSWRPINSTSNERECRAWVEAQPGETEKAQGGFVKIKSLTCLPDTVDPRGAKGERR